MVGPRGFGIPVESDPGITLVSDTPRGRGAVTAAVTEAQAALRQAGLSELNIPLAGAAPLTAAVWWASLTPEHQALYQSAYPQRVGPLDGLPAADRHTANMIALRGMIEEQAEINRTAFQDLRLLPSIMGVDQFRLDRLTGLLGRLEAAEQSPDGAPLYLLGIDNAEFGRAIVAVGNPDTSRHVGVLVPGIMTGLNAMGTLIDRADLLRSTSLGLTPENSGNVAVVAWLGYNTPALTEAMSQQRAEVGAPLLQRFINGLRTTSQLDPGVDGQARLGIIAHSYGAVLTGIAASRGEGLDTDVIITLGAPGMTVSDSTRLMLRGPVWSGAFDGEFVSSWGPIFHNTAPHTWEFGGNRFVVDVTDHSGYWEPGSVSVGNQVRALLGDDHAITPDMSDLTRRLTDPGQADTLWGPRPLVVPPLPAIDPPPDNLLGRRSDVSPGEFQGVPGITVGYGTPVNEAGYTPVGLSAALGLGWTGVLSGQPEIPSTGGNVDSVGGSGIPEFGAAASELTGPLNADVAEGWNDASLDWGFTDDSPYDSAIG